MSKIAWGPIGEEVYLRTYSRTKPTGESETWPETVHRTVAGNVELAGLLAPSEDEQDELRDAIESMRIIPAGRHLWASGTASQLGLYNCHRAGWDVNDPAAHFAFTFDQLMLGGGVGANYSTDPYLRDMRMPTSVCVPLFLVDDQGLFDEARLNPADYAVAPDARSIDLVVDDSREGWVEALRALIAEFYEAPTLSGRYLRLDLRQVRPAGAPIRGFGGTASGPAPLMRMLVDVAIALCQVSAHGRWTPLIAMEIDHAIASCVVAGNVRRSARMSILHWKDDSIFDFINCKSDYSQHWSTNISVEVDDEFWSAYDAGDEHAHAVMQAVAEGMLANGEPGLYNSDRASVGERGDVRSTNPCVSGDSLLLTENGWVSFADAAARKDSNTIIVDGRVSYNATEDGVEHPENWSVDLTSSGPVKLPASEVFVTKRDAELVKVSLSNGLSVRVTPDHLVATTTGMVAAGELRSGIDKVLVTTGFLPTEPLGTPQSRGEIDAVLIGLIAGDGCISDGIAHIDLWGDKQVLEGVVKGWVSDLFSEFGSTYVSPGSRDFSAFYETESDRKVRISSSFLAAYLKGEYGFTKESKHDVPPVFFSHAVSREARFYVAALAFCDGTINRHGGGDSSSSIRINQSNRELLSGVQLICLANGISSSLVSRRPEMVRMMPDGRGGLKEYKCKENFELIFSMHKFEFSRFIGFLDGPKHELALEMFTRPSRKYNVTARVLDVTPDGVEDVFCLREPVRRILCANGVTMRRCGEIALQEWEQCCLGHVNLAHPDHQDTRTLRRSFELMAKFLVRATLAKASDPKQEAIKGTNRRIGVGVFGFQEWLASKGLRYSDVEDPFSPAGWSVSADLLAWQAWARDAAYDEADRLLVPRPIKVTTVAPTGTIAKLPGTTEGIHPIYSRYYIRRVRYAANDPRVEGLREQGLEVVDDIYADNTIVIAHYVRDAAAAHYGDDLIESSDELSVEQQLAVQWLFQRYFADNAVSFTVNLVPGQTTIDQLIAALSHYRGLKGTTVFPDMSRPLSPLERITKEQYDAAHAPHEVGQSFDDCANGACPVR